MKSKLKPVIIFLLFLTLIASFVFSLWQLRHYFFRMAARTLIYEEQPSKCDALLILAGEFPSRTIAAGDIYNQGLVTYIIAPNFKESPGMNLLKQRNLPFKNSNELAMELLLEMGVPSYAILKPHNPTERTKHEAEEARRIIEKHKDIKCLATVTSRYHSRRTNIIFANELKGLGTELKSFTPSFDTYNEETWWENPVFVRLTVTELIKLITMPIY